MEILAKRENMESLSKQFAHRLVALIESQLVTYREYIPWADTLIMALPEPPVWIIDLATKKHLLKAGLIVRGYMNSEPIEVLPWDLWTDEFIAALFLRYERNELSWASFLNEAGRQADNSEGGRKPCEYFYVMLNALEKADFAESLETKQRDEVSERYGDIIPSVRRTYEAFRAFRRPGE